MWKVIWRTVGGVDFDREFGGIRQAAQYAVALAYHGATVVERVEIRRTDNGSVALSWLAGTGFSEVSRDARRYVASMRP